MLDAATNIKAEQAKAVDDLSDYPEWQQIELACCEAGSLPTGSWLGPPYGPRPRDVERAWAMAT